MPAATVNANLAKQTAETRDRVQRIIDAASEDQFATEPNTSRGGAA